MPTQWIDGRRSGVLLHITSLPGVQPCGSLGKEAYSFIDMLRWGGCSVWQFLPLGPTRISPYESVSSFAGNPELLDLDDFVARGCLQQDVYQAVVDGQCSTRNARTQASQIFYTQLDQDKVLTHAFEQFCTDQEDWLDDYSLFMAAKSLHGENAWWMWPEDIRQRHPQALARMQDESMDTIRQTRFEQFMFAQQWAELKAYAESQHVLLFGDMPIYAGHDSADVWAHQSYFTVDAAGECEAVAGVPPDYFSESGQRWGNPLYCWDTLQVNDFDWWVRRVEVQFERMHLLRIDHFRGLESCWVIPGKEKDGRIGTWQKVPGEALLNTLNTRLGHVPLVAEDLGMITPEVIALRQQFGLPGMKILQFAFDSDDENPYLPPHHEVDSVAYTGTHDNDTTLGWFEHQTTHVRERIDAYTDTDSDDMPWPLIHLALQSTAKLAIIPMQDLLALGSDARLNTPGTIEGNWNWRMSHAQMNDQDVWAHLRKMNEQEGRTHV